MSWSGWYYHPLLEPIEKTLNRPLLIYTTELGGSGVFWVDNILKTMTELRRKLRQDQWKQILKKWRGKDTPVPSFRTLADLFGWLYELLLEKQPSPESIKLILKASPPVIMDWQERLNRWSTPAQANKLTRKK